MAHEAISMWTLDRAAYFLVLVCDGTVSPLASQVTACALVPHSLRHLFGNKHQVTIPANNQGRLGRLARHALFKTAKGPGLGKVIVRPSRANADSSFWDLDMVVLVIASLKTG